MLTKTRRPRVRVTYLRCSHSRTMRIISPAPTTLRTSASDRRFLEMLNRAAVDFLGRKLEGRASS